MNVEEFLPNDLDVQKAVVESLAADKAEQDERLQSLARENEALKAEVARQGETIAEMKKALEKVGDVLATNADTELSSKVSLLDRNLDLADRFPGETRDHVLEVLKIARDAAEKDGRIRLSQILESVLLVNEPNGTLAQKRGELEKLFTINANVLTGPVIDALKKMGLAYKNGEEFLLAAEILKRNY